MTFEAFSSREGRHRQREQRIHVCPGPASAVAVHAVFNGLGYVCSEGSLTRSMSAARKLAHRVMEEADGQPSQHLQRQATLRPITAEQACVACNTGGMREYRSALWTKADHDLDHMTRVHALFELADMGEA